MIHPLNPVQINLIWNYRQNAASLLFLASRYITLICFLCYNLCKSVNLVAYNSLILTVISSCLLNMDDFCEWLLLFLDIFFTILFFKEASMTLYNYGSSHHILGLQLQRICAFPISCACSHLDLFS